MFEKSNIFSVTVHREKFLHWLWQLKFSAAKVVNQVTDKMMHACGGTGYKVRNVRLLRLAIEDGSFNGVFLNLGGTPPWGGCLRLLWGGYRVIRVQQGTSSLVY